MKNTFTKLFVGLLLIVGISIISQSCKSSKKAATLKDQEETEISVLCAGGEYLSDAQRLRFSAVGESMDQMTSKKKALSEARAGLASQMQTLIKGVIDNYLKSGEHNNKEDLMERYEGLTREVINQKLTGTRIICEKMTKTKTGNFKTYVCIELGGSELLQSISNRLSNDEMLKIDYNYEKFKKTFEDEMNKQAQ
ncbi:MAG: hypothetical protein M0R21_12940 [Lentimicrobiaceae bacterium]|jgi:hypothetical protein|nr:hypothetical protein [Lentimicrobiaceae bacterium]